MMQLVQFGSGFPDEFEGFGQRLGMRMGASGACGRAVRAWHGVRSRVQSETIQKMTRETVHIGILSPRPLSAVLSAVDDVLTLAHSPSVPCSVLDTVMLAKPKFAKGFTNTRNTHFRGSRLRYVFSGRVSDDTAFPSPAAQPEGLSWRGPLALLKLAPRNFPHGQCYPWVTRANGTYCITRMSIATRHIALPAPARSSRTESRTSPARPTDHPSSARASHVTVRRSRRSGAHVPAMDRHVRQCSVEPSADQRTSVQISMCTAAIRKKPNRQHCYGSNDRASDCNSVCCANPRCGGVLLQPQSGITWNNCSKPCCFFKSVAYNPALTMTGDPLWVQLQRATAVGEKVVRSGFFRHNGNSAQVPEEITMLRNAAIGNLGSASGRKPVRTICEIGFNLGHSAIVRASTFEPCICAHSQHPTDDFP